MAGPTPQDAIRADAGRITEAQLDAFRSAVRATSAGAPPTFATRFRGSEFQWLDRLQVDMHQLLHTAQEYEFHQPLSAGQAIVTTSRLLEDKSRRGLRFVSVRTEIEADGQLAVVAETQFVLRMGEAR